jgi:tetratricopeptide (TPR) repeat protein
MVGAALLLTGSVAWGATPAEAHGMPRSPASGLAFSAAMHGRKADALAAVQSLAQGISVSQLLAMGDSGWDLSQQYAALVRFGLWDELIALQPPDPRAQGLTAGYLYGRGVALAARGRMADARDTLARLHALGSATRGETRAGRNSLRDIVSVAEPIVAARIAASAQRSAEAVARLEEAVAAEDRLADADPPDWFFPARHLLGAQLLIAGDAAEAQRVYRQDLLRNPHNGWALYGLAAALQREGRAAEAQRVTRRFRAAWKGADVQLRASAFWFAGPDTTSCECQRAASADRQPGGELLGAQHEAGVH